MSTMIWNGDAFAHEAITVSNSAKSFTAVTYAPSGTVPPVHRAVVTVEDQNLRYTIDGSTTPTTSVGHLAKDEYVIILTSKTMIQNFKAIRATGSDSKIKVTYFR
ncbi:hypothetical protein LCGC14_0337880 [marine sediment metagenome]|uniref:Uncharacterized protein n=1 Tax=marine sediment metagenome TaxID=412755 RepID=A0A0F9TJX5_9ZZZZ